MFMDRNGYQSGINNYVPAMQYASSLIDGGVAPFTLGTPAASDDDCVIAAAGIDGDAVAGTVVVTSLGWVSDSPYGRNLIFTVSGDPGATGIAVDVRGKDYLGQPMIERFSVANTITAIQYGKKAFYVVDSTKIVTAATGAITAKLGTGSQLGLPYKGDVVWAKENNVRVELHNRVFTMWADLAIADAVAGTSIFLRAPCPGYIAKLRSQPNALGSTTNAADTVELGGTAITGLTTTADQDSATEVTDVPTTEGYNANNRFVAGGLIEIVHAATTAAKAMRIGVDIQPIQFIAADTTDPGTVSTGDPRGMYTSLMTLDGTAEVIVGMMGDNAMNSSGNGGLHGIKHYYA